jgi:hypothetical protein
MEVAPVIVEAVLPSYSIKYPMSVIAWDDTWSG